MMKFDLQGFTILCKGMEEEDNRLAITGFEGSGAVLDLTEYTQICRIDKKAFLSCKSIKKLILPESVEWVDDWAFSKCSNLQTVEIKKTFEKSIFGKGVFEGCTNLTHVSFGGLPEQTSMLLALTANLMPNEHLLRSDDLGEMSWYTKWDIALLAHLQESSKTEQEKKNCFLCFKRLKNDFGLEQSAKDEICRYIKDRSFESQNPAAWITLKEDCTEDVSYFALYLDIVHPGAAVMEKMIQDINATHMQIKAFLINEASRLEGEDTFFEGLLL